MKNTLPIFVFILTLGQLFAQKLEIGMEMVTGPARSSFKGELADMVGFSELEVSEAEIDSAFQIFDLTAPRWLKELFPGIRIEIDQQLAKKLNRNISTVRFFAKYQFIGGSFAISDPRLTVPLESGKLKNQLKAIRLSVGGKAEELATHLAKVALADADRVSPFFAKRYDLEVYADLKKIILGNEALMEWGKDGQNNLDFEVTGGLRFTADPSPVVDLGSILFIRERIDSLMEGGILRPVEDITDAVAEGIQNIVFGKFKDPRVVPSIGWFLRPQLLAGIGGSFSVVAGTEISIHNHIAIKGTKPMPSIYAFAGLRWKVFNK